MKYDVLGFGALNIDYFYQVTGNFARKYNIRPGKEYKGKNLENFLKQLQTQTFLGKSGGGQSANTIFAMSQMGFRTGFIGKVGEKDDGDFLLKGFPHIDISMIKREKKSGMLFSLSIKNEPDRSMFVYPNSNDTVQKKDVDEDYINNTTFLHLSSFVGDISFKTQRYFVKKLKKQIKIAFNPGELYARRGLHALMPILKKTYILFLSENETYLLTWEDEYKKGAQQLLEKGPKIVVVTLGKEGSHVFTHTQDFFVKTTPVKKVVDTTGAGDVYQAGFLAGLLLKKSLKECGIFASYIAAKSITGIGRSKYPNKNDLKRL